MNYGHLFVNTLAAFTHAAMCFVFISIMAKVTDIELKVIGIVGVAWTLTFFVRHTANIYIDVKAWWTSR